MTAATLAMAGTAMAATGTLSVSAKISNACSVADGTLDFGSLDTLGGGAVSATSSGVTVTCTKGDGYTMTAGTGSHASGTQAYLSNGTDTIPYTVTIPSLSTGTGAAQTIAITGNIAKNAYTTASSGTYTDSVTLTVTP